MIMIVKQSLKNWGEQYYNEDPGDANELNVTVELTDGVTIRKFIVTADYSINYYANELE